MNKENAFVGNQWCRSRLDDSARVEEVRSGSSYSSSGDMRVHFGLGGTSKNDYVEIRWPSGLIEKFPGLAVDCIHDLREGTGTAVPAASVRN